MTLAQNQFIEAKDDDTRVSVTRTVGLPVDFADSPILDGSGRLRVSNNSLVIDNKNVGDRHDHRFYETTDGTGTIVHQPNQSTVLYTSGTVAGNKTSRQSNRYFSYVPAKSQLIEMTGALGAANADVARRMGYFDDENGLYWEKLDTNYLVIRSFVTGSVDEIRKPQSEWNLDKLDGDGPSGITSTLDVYELFMVDFRWFGADRVRFGFRIGGKTVYVHEHDTADVASVPYMTTPSLPIRYEMEVINNTTAETMTEGCFAISSEGGYTPPGEEFSASMEWAERSITTRQPIFAIRMKADTRTVAKLLDAGFFTRSNDALFEINHVHEPSAITATWADVGGGSDVEYSTDISAVTGNPSHKIDHRYTPAGQGSSAGQGDVEKGTINAHGFISQNVAADNSQMFVIYGTSRTGTADVAAHITWSEIS